MWTHLNYAFALIDSNNKIASMNSFDKDLYPRITALKQVNPSLKVFISVGGWDAGGKVFSNMVGSASSRKTFIDSALAFMNTYSFDGIDVDWEYPVAPDRDGADNDFVNFVTFMKELKAACGSKDVTLTLPSSYWYLKGFDVVALQNHVDWFNFMSYDIHGTWDGNSPFTSAVVAPHTNLTEIQDGLDLLWRNKIYPQKVVLGLGFYGRSFTLKDPSCKTPGCAFSGGAKAGSCTATSGVLSNAEIQRIIKSKGLTPFLERAAGVKYITWDKNQWVSYDDAETLKIKRNFANNLGIGGTMVWALDLDDPVGTSSAKNLKIEALRAIDGDQIDKYPDFAQSKLNAISMQNNINLMTFWTECMKEPTCPKGYRELTLGHGKVFDADQARVSADGCHGGWGGYNRALCIEDSVYIAGDCKWYGKPGACKETCPTGYLFITANSHIGKKSCNNGHFQSFCCNSGIYAHNINQCPASNADIALSGGLAKRDLEKGLEVFGTPQECAALAYGAGIAGGSILAGLGAFYVYNKQPGSWSFSSLRGWIWQPAKNKPYNPKVKNPACTTTTTIIRIQTTTTTNNPVTKGCNYRDHPNACGHYMSVIRQDPAMYDTLWCKLTQMKNRVAPAKWTRQHTRSWRLYIDNLPGLAPNDGNNKCEKDEYPPLRFMGERLPGVTDYTQWVRLLPKLENGDAGKMWVGVCLNVRSSVDIQGGPVSASTCTEYESITYTMNGFKLTSQNAPANMVDDNLSINPCLPTMLTDDPGFALFTDDGWYKSARNSARSTDAVDLQKYRYNPIPAQINGRAAPRSAQNIAKRWLHEEYDGALPEDIIVDDGNITRPASEQELFLRHGIKKCESHGCKEEYANGVKVDLLKPLVVPDLPVTAETATATGQPPMIGSEGNGHRVVTTPKETLIAASHTVRLQEQKRKHHRRDNLGHRHHVDT